MRISAVSFDTVEREEESNTLLKEVLFCDIKNIYTKKIGVLCLYENTG